jgi:hypothetical protein
VYCLFLNSLLNAGEPLATLLIRFYRRFRSRTFLYTSFEKIEWQAAALCPLDRVETEVVTQPRVRAGLDEQSHQVGVTEDHGEDQRRLPAVVSLVDIGSGSERSANGFDVTRSNRLSEWNSRTHSAAL